MCSITVIKFCTAFDNTLPQHLLKFIAATQAKKRYCNVIKFQYFLSGTFSMCTQHLMYSVHSGVSKLYLSVKIHGPKTHQHINGSNPKYLYRTISKMAAIIKGTNCLHRLGMKVFLLRSLYLLCCLHLQRHTQVCYTRNTYLIT